MSNAMMEDTPELVQAEEDDAPTVLTDERLKELVKHWKPLLPEIHAALCELQELRKAPKGPPRKSRYVRIDKVEMAVPGGANAQACERAAADICSAFGWSGAPEGDFDWSQVHDRLNWIAMKSRR